VDAEISNLLSNPSSSSRSLCTKCFDAMTSIDG
jgi:hypothetical protein